MKLVKGGLAVLVLAILTGCGGGGSKSTPSPVTKMNDPSGNQVITLNNGLTLSGILAEDANGNITTVTPGGMEDNLGALCNATRYNVTGQEQPDNSISWTAQPLNGSPTFTINMTGTVPVNQAARGNWTETNPPTCALGSGTSPSGTWVSSQVLPVDGTWTGTLTPNNSPTESVSLVVKQDSNGNITGTLTLNNDPCYGTISVATSGTIIGEGVTLNSVYADGNQSELQFPMPGIRSPAPITVSGQFTFTHTPGCVEPYGYGAPVSLTLQ